MGQGKGKSITVNMSWIWLILLGGNTNKGQFIWDELLCYNDWDFE